jgi:hypothetical protein
MELYQNNVAGWAGLFTDHSLLTAAAVTTGIWFCLISEEARRAEDEKRVIAVDNIYTLSGNWQCGARSENASLKEVGWERGRRRVVVREIAPICVCVLAREGFALRYASAWTPGCVRSSSWLASGNVCPTAGWLVVSCCHNHKSAGELL